ncbi:PKD domain-containing protein [Flavisolibacter nicotianae]|uniref:PKD domain-containing protein n=1 Tax=Flavisolibacter nicotianae TaxID=2364882 RepID=UPI0013C52F8B|nr:PKD domain-containing protein [Flavisolibacter nicotianae]
MSLFALLFIVTASTKAQTEIEANNDFTSANNLAINTQSTGAMCPDGDMDYFKTTIPYNGMVRVYAEVTNTGSSNGYAYLSVYDNRQASGSLTSKGIGGYLNVGETAVDSIDLYCVAAGETLYFRLNQLYQCFSYKLRYVMLNTSGDVDLEPNNSFTDAVAMNIDQSIGGHIGYTTGGNVADPEDYFKFTLPANGIVRVYMDATNTGSSNGYFSVSGYDNRQTNGSLFSKTVGGYLNAGASATDSVDLYCTSAGETIYLRTSQQYQCFSYHLRYTILNASGDVDAEPNNSFADAIGFPITDTASGHLGYLSGGAVADDVDFFKTVLPTSGVLRIYAVATNTGNSNGYFNINGYDQRQSNGSLFSKSIGGYLNAGQTAIDSVDLYCQGQGDTLYFRLSQQYQCFNYKLYYTVLNAVGEVDAEPNNSFAEATQFSTADTIHGRIGYIVGGTVNDAEDYFKTVLPANGILRVYMQATNTGNSNGYLYINGYDQRQANGSLFTRSVGGYLAAGQSAIDSVDLYCSAAGDTIYFRATQQYQCFNYILRYAIINPSSDVDLEPNNDFAHAVSLNEGDSAAGHVGYVSAGTVADPYDYYKTVLPSDGAVRIYVEATNTGNSNGYLYINGYDQRQANGSLFSKSIGGYLAAGQSAIDSVDVYCRSANDTFYFQLSQQYQCFGYKISYKMIHVDNTLAITDLEPNNTQATAISFAEKDTVKANIGYSLGGNTDNADYYKTAVPHNGTMRVYVQATNTSGLGYGYFYLSGYDKNGSQVFYKNIGGYSAPGVTSYDTLNLYCQSAGAFTFQVTNANACFSYTIRYETTLGADTTVYVCPGYTTNIGGLYNVKPFTTVHYENMASPGNDISPDNVGAGTYRLMVYNGTDECSRDTAIITVANHPQPQPGYTVNTANQCQSGNSFAFTNTSTIAAGTMQYQWNFGDGSATVTTTNPTHSYTTPGSYIVHLIATSNNGCIDSTQSTITVYPQPAAGFTLGNSAQCQGGNSFAFVNTSTISSGTLTYQWEFGDGTTATAANPSHTYTSAGLFSVKLLVTSNNGCKDSSVQTVAVYAQPSASFTINSATQCEKGNQYVFTNTSTGASSYAWQLGDGSTATVTNVSHSYATTGSYTVKLVVGTANGCADSVQQTITVNTSPSLGADKTVTVGCAGGTTDITTLFNTAGYNSVVYSTSNPQNAPAGTYTLVVSYASGCADTAQITVLDATVTTVSATANNTKVASRECTDAQGWTHYYYDNGTPADFSDDIRLLSIQKNGNDIGSLGDGTFQVEVKATAGAGSGHAVNVSSSFIPQGASYYSMNRYWNVMPTQQPSTPVNVRFYYNTQDLTDVNGDYPAGPINHSQLTVYKVDTGNPDPTTNWAGATAVHFYQNSNLATLSNWVYTNLGSNNHQAELQVSSFSGGGAGALSASTLPVSFTRFDAVAENETVKLNWMTASESNSKNFTVMRSLDGRNFESVGTVAAAGTSNSMRNYSFTDGNAGKFMGQTLYYKLAQADRNGQVTFTDIRKVKMAAFANLLTLYTNPVHSEAVLKYRSLLQETVQVSIVDQNGRTVFAQKRSVERGVNQIRLSTAHLAPGIYEVVVTSSTDRQQVKLLKQ